ncbi:MAG: SLBB domain-containing protein, partial [Campylobacterota bacterium]|nr:SLBB domain-containing protein [Campylobacterota bacterium]
LKYILTDELNTTIKPFDVIKVSKYKDEKIFFSVSGEVVKPGKYLFAKGATLDDVIQIADGFTDFADKNIIITRTNMVGSKKILKYILTDELNTTIKPFDVIKVSKYKDEKIFFSVSGEVVKPGKYLFAKGATLDDVIQIADGFTDFADKNIIITRTAIVDSKRRLKNISTDDLNTTIEPFDVIKVNKYRDWNSVLNVKVNGSIQNPGSYMLENGSTVADLVKIASGMRDDADIDAAYILRKSLLQKQKALKENQLITLQSQLSAAIYASAFDNQSDNYAKIKLLNIQQQVETLKKQLSSSSNNFGKISLNLDDAKENSSYSFELNDGDTLVVPKKEFFVYVDGGVLSPATLVYSKKRDVLDYINKAGGFSEDYSTQSSYVLKPNGEAKKIVFVDGKIAPMKIKAGDTIVIGIKAQYAK